uniref:Uncharacterized protein n=1 Tax=Timspurckia oligopyrenoides TaxID=708627 RepID=A0A7S0ZF12_9RHOD|mmetsp:Transcript_2798/g.4931  ORF Transcript_2798/g.4931 Transcript_2798/m.4931 type:complete len:352 (+) Transcript_2798:78-1133(+)|eukprot:CAMPEP_0182452020 /NCGR_PEP_ID=MMETSP1172-20130603/44028_1 /TAXON_ID=708627 /ORGANISM="Timspurckia oligopyrenoides, Strain CCMP3278" /LENGTH=351 /DNA_ID=CAMNT_0024649831 /DNA_START=55 /DNA_END=1110 /DNA_ORIENTATION=+
MDEPTRMMLSCMREVGVYVAKMGEVMVNYAEATAAVYVQQQQQMQNTTPADLQVAANQASNAAAMATAAVNGAVERVNNTAAAGTPSAAPAPSKKIQKQSKHEAKQTQQQKQNNQQATAASVAPIQQQQAPQHFVLQTPAVLLPEPSASVVAARSAGPFEEEKESSAITTGKGAVNVPKEVVSDVEKSQKTEDENKKAGDEEDGNAVGARGGKKRKEVVAPAAEGMDAQKRMRMNWTHEEEDVVKQIIKDNEGQTYKVVLGEIQKQLDGKRSQTQCKGHLRNLLKSNRVKMDESTSLFWNHDKKDDEDEQFLATIDNTSMETDEKTKKSLEKSASVKPRASRSSRSATTDK